MSKVSLFLFYTDIMFHFVIKVVIVFVVVVVVLIARDIKLVKKILQKQ